MIRNITVFFILIFAFLASACSSNRSIRLEAEQLVSRKLKICTGSMSDSEKCGCIGTKDACSSERKSPAAAAPAETKAPLIDAAKCEIVDSLPIAPTLPALFNATRIPGEPWTGSVAQQMDVQERSVTACVQAIVNSQSACQCYAESLNPSGLQAEKDFGSQSLLPGRPTSSPADATAVR